MTGNDNIRKRVLRETTVFALVRIRASARLLVEQLTRKVMPINWTAHTNCFAQMFLRFAISLLIDADNHSVTQSM